MGRPADIDKNEPIKPIEPIEPIDRNEQFVRLLTQHENDLYRYVLSLVFDSSAVDDVMQDVAIALWKKFDEYDSARPFFPWACRFAYFHVLKYRTKVGKSRELFGDKLIEQLSDDYGNEYDVLMARRQALDLCLKKLPVDDRRLVQLRYGSSETVQNLAKSTRTSVHKLYHALERIRGTLMDCVNKTLVREGWDEIA